LGEAHRLRARLEKAFVQRDQLRDGLYTAMKKGFRVQGKSVAVVSATRANQIEILKQLNAVKLDIDVTQEQLDRIARSAS
jgi:uncharacterized protein with FMN-binding domain